MTRPAAGSPSSQDPSGPGPRDHSARVRRCRNRPAAARATRRETGWSSAAPSAVQAGPNQPVGRRVGRELDHLDRVEQGQLGILSRLRPVSQFPGPRPPVERAVVIFLLVPPLGARLDETHLVHIQVGLTVLQPPLRLPERSSGHQFPAVPGLAPRPHVFPQALPPAAERSFAVEPYVQLVPGPQQRLVHHLGSLVAMLVTADRQQPFVSQPHDHRPVPGITIGSPDDPPDIGLVRRREMIHEQVPDHRLLGRAQAVQDPVRVRSQRAVQAVDPAILIRRQGLLGGREHPPHLVK